MAWIDDRIWCHPKFTELSAPAFRVYVQGVAYSTGMSTRGHLTAEQQRLVGGNQKVRGELVKAHLWDVNGKGGIRIHDWDDYNKKRDDRREADRERKRAERAKEHEESTGQSTTPSTGTSAGQSTGRSTGQSAGSSAVGPRAGARESDGSDGSDGFPKEESFAVDAQHDNFEGEPEPREDPPADLHEIFLRETAR